MRQLTRLSVRRVRWTRFESTLIIAAILLLASSTGVEVYRWMNPPSVRAAARAQENPTETPTETTPTPTETTPTATEAAPTATETPLTGTGPAQTPTETAPTATEVTQTVVPTELPTQQPSVTPFSAAPIGEPPLVLDKSASVQIVQAGEQFTFVVVVSSNSEEPQTIEVHDAIDEQLEVLEAGSDKGSCSTEATVVCSLTASKNAPARITINVRARATVSSGTSLVSQALARDERGSTASSERVVVTVVEAATQVVVPTPTHDVAPTEPRANEPEVAVAPAEQEATTVPAATSPAEQEATTDVQQVPQAASPSATQPTSITPPTTTPVSTRPNQALPPTLVPGTTNTQPRPTTPASNTTLPSTAATTPSFGLGLGLLGLALTLHGARRVRRADKRLAAAGAVMSELSPLVTHAFEFQHATVDEIERMRQQSDEMVELTSSKKSKGG